MAAGDPEILHRRRCSMLKSARSESRSRARIVLDLHERERLAMASRPSRSCNLAERLLAPPPSVAVRWTAIRLPNGCVQSDSAKSPPHLPRAARLRDPARRSGRQVAWRRSATQVPAVVFRRPVRSAPASTSPRTATPRKPLRNADDPCPRASAGSRSQNRNAPDTAQSPGPAGTSKTNVSDGSSAMVRNSFTATLRLFSVRARTAYASAFFRSRRLVLSVPTRRTRRSPLSPRCGALVLCSPRQAA